MWEHLLLLSAEDLRRVRRFVLEHLAMRTPPFSMESDLYVALIENVRARRTRQLQGLCCSTQLHHRDFPGSSDSDRADAQQSQLASLSTLGTGAHSKH